MTKAEAIIKLPEPWRTIANHGSIDYTTKNAADHAYVRERGFKPEMHGDCSYSAKGLPGLSLSSYGDWGSIYDDACDLAWEYFTDMYEKNLITLWRARLYIKGRCFDYVENYGWETYVKEIGWSRCQNPLETQE